MRYTVVGDGVRDNPVRAVLDSVLGEVVYLPGSTSPRDVARQAIPVVKNDAGKSVPDFGSATIVVLDDCPVDLVTMMERLKGKNARSGLVVSLGVVVPDADAVSGTDDSAVRDAVMSWVAGKGWPDPVVEDEDPFASDDLFGDPDDEEDWGFGDLDEDADSVPGDSVGLNEPVSGLDPTDAGVGHKSPSEGVSGGFGGVSDGGMGFGSAEPDTDVMSDGTGKVDVAEPDEVVYRAGDDDSGHSDVMEEPVKVPDDVVSVVSDVPDHDADNVDREDSLGAQGTGFLDAGFSDGDMESVDDSGPDGTDIIVENVELHRDIEPVDVVKTGPSRASGDSGRSRVPDDHGHLGEDNGQAVGPGSQDDIQAEGNLVTAEDEVIVPHVGRPVVSDKESGSAGGAPVTIDGDISTPRISLQDRDYVDETINVAGPDVTFFQSNENPAPGDRVKETSNSEVDDYLRDPAMTDVDVPQHRAPFMDDLSEEDRVGQYNARQNRALDTSYSRSSGTADISKSRLFYVTGVSGGVGKTTLSHTMASFTAHAYKWLGINDAEYSDLGNQNVYLIEFDWENSKLAELLDTDNTIQALAEAMADHSGSVTSDFIRSKIGQCTAVTPDGLNVIPAPYRQDWASSSPERNRNLIKAYMAVIQYLMRDEHGSVIFIDAPTLIPVAQDPLAKTLFSTLNPYVILVSRIDQADNVKRASSLLVSPLNGKAVSGSGKTQKKVGYGVDNSDVSLLVNRVPSSAGVKEQFIQFKEDSILDPRGIIPYYPELEATFVGDVNNKAVTQSIQKNVAKSLKNIGFPMFEVILSSGNANVRQNTKVKKKGILSRLKITRR